MKRKTTDLTPKNIKSEFSKEGHVLSFPVAGIGASAGGLEALQVFFKNMPPEPGLAFVIVQHLSPDYKSLMDELLARYTTMKIHRVEDGMEVEENHIYLIPPRNNMTIFHGKLYLSEQQEIRNLNLPIDIFLRSLAKDQEKNAIGIILSGTGSDGTLGIRAIKEYGGIAMVQDDRSAKFDGMPRSSISTGMVDYILPPDELAKELANYVKHPLIKQREQIEDMLNSNVNYLSKVIAILRDAKGVDFSAYKENTIIRRLEKRISINRFERIEDYVKFLTNNNREISILFNELLIGVTRFFRDEDAFKKVKKEVIPYIIKQNEKRQDIRVWVPGCSTGEEVYSLAMLFKEYMSENSTYKDVKIFATDLDSESLEYAGTGIYPESIVSDVSTERITRYFIKKSNGYQINDSIRGMVVFARHNILQDPPFSKIDLISCRNLLIYLNSDVQQKILSMFYLSLVENGYLFLGSSESLGNVSDGFVVIDNKSKVYRQQKGFKPTHIHNFGVNTGSKYLTENKSVNSFYRGARPKSYVLDGIFDDILGDYIPPSVIIDENFDVIHTIHQVNKFLTIPVGQISLNLFKMMPKNLGVVANSLVRRTEKKDNQVIIENIQNQDNPETTLALACKKLNDKKTGEIFYLISFIEKKYEAEPEKVRIVESIDANMQYNERIEQLERELQFKSESLQATVEELETSNEELQSSNEELIASNEELQSTNEELQSVNEELYTVNSEHIRKIEELTELNSDMDNLLKNTNIGTLFLDRDLTIRKCNNIASQLTNILVTDIGRPINHLSFDSLYIEFPDDIYKVVETLNPLEKEILINKCTWYLMRILPYRTAENAVDGIIIIFINITSLKKSEFKNAKLQERLEMSMNIGGMSWWEWDIKKNVVTTGWGKYGMLGYSEGEIGSTYQDWVNLLHPDDVKATMESMKELIEGHSEYYFAEYRIQTKEGNFLWYRDKGGVTERDKNGNMIVIGGVVMNITNEKQEEQRFTSEINTVQKKLQGVDEKYELLFNTMIQGVVYQDASGKITNANAAAENILGLSLDQMKGLTSIDPKWKSVKPDGTDFPGEDHPAMVSLKTGKPVLNVVMGVYNPQKKAHTWININAIPLFEKDNETPVSVYTTFEDITWKIQK
jgi:two-component system, chemotaxis family, CheB/CheR fusion protein